MRRRTPTTAELDRDGAGPTISAEFAPCSARFTSACRGTDYVHRYAAAADRRGIAQVLKHLKASGLSRALLLSFGVPRMEYRRLVFGAQIAICHEATSRLVRQRTQMAPNHLRPLLPLTLIRSNHISVIAAFP